MTVATTIDANAWLNYYLAGEDGDGDLARAMLAAFAQTVEVGTGLDAVRGRLWRGDRGAGEHA